MVFVDASGTAHTLARQHKQRNAKISHIYTWCQHVCGLVTHTRTRNMLALYEVFFIVFRRSNEQYVFVDRLITQIAIIISKFFVAHFMFCSVWRKKTIHLPWTRIYVGTNVWCVFVCECMCGSLSSHQGKLLCTALLDKN